jgi:hypothetical protein
MGQTARITVTSREARLRSRMKSRMGEKSIGEGDGDRCRSRGGFISSLTSRVLTALGFASWNSRINSGELTFSTSSHVLCATEYPFHFRRYCSFLIQGSLQLRIPDDRQPDLGVARCDFGHARLFPNKGSEGMHGRRCGSSIGVARPICTHRARPL